MPKSPTGKRGSRLRVGIMALAALIPPLCIVPLIYSDAVLQAQAEADITGGIALHQINNIVGRAEQMAGLLTPLAGQPCNSVKAPLQRMGALQPYFRALVLIDQRQLYCSSASGEFTLAVQDLSGDAAASNPGLHLRMVAGTPLVPERPALLVFRGLEDGRGSLVTIDGQYLLDLVAAAERNGRFSLSIAVNNREPLVAHAQAADAFALERHLASATYPLSITVAVPRSVLETYRATQLEHYLPFVALASILLAYLARQTHVRKLSMAAEIRKGLRLNEFHVCYQPIVDLKSGLCVGMEALMRWQRPYGAVRPDIFIAVAEENGLAIPLTRHLLKLISRDLAKVTLPPHLYLSINLSADHLNDPMVIGDIARFQQAGGPASPRMVLEITERTVLPSNQMVLDNMRALRALGATFAIDDFGTGQSSLAYLEQFTIECLKIDQRFVSSINTNAINVPVLELIISLGASLELKLIAEGVETEVQAAYLRQHGVRYAQGYLFAHPMPMQDLMEWLDSQSALPGRPLVPGISGDPETDK